MPKVRIQKFLSEAGVASRRQVEEMFQAGRISVNGETVTKLPCFVDSSDEICVDGRAVRKHTARKVYILLNKPRGVVCTARDEPKYNRPKAVDLIPPMASRVYCVGRLDEYSTGLILLTNDGELTNRLTHPRYGVPKTYVVRVDGRVTSEDLAALRKGMYIDGKRAKPVSAKVLRRGGGETLLEIDLHEGRNRQVRRMLARLGHKVRRLHRRTIGPITDRGLKIGKYRRLAAKELALLRQAAGLGDDSRQRPR